MFQGFQSFSAFLFACFAVYILLRALRLQRCRFCFAFQFRNRYELEWPPRPSCFACQSPL